MNVKVTIKQLSKKLSKVSESDFWLENEPATVEALIRETVRTCVSEYNLRVDNKKAGQPLTDQQIVDMSEIGKIAFGINYGDKKANEDEAVYVAMQAFEDGLVRIFKDDEELTELAQNIDLKENDLLTFIRLTMLAGRMF